MYRRQAYCFDCCRKTNQLKIRKIRESRGENVNQEIQGKVGEFLKFWQKSYGKIMISLLYFDRPDNWHKFMKLRNQGKFVDIVKKSKNDRIKCCAVSAEYGCFDLVASIWSIFCIEKFCSLKYSDRVLTTTTLDPIFVYPIGQNNVGLKFRLP